MCFVAGEEGEGGVPCWEPVANYSSPAGPHHHPTLPPPHPGNPPRGGVDYLFESDHSHPPLNQWLLVVAPSLSSLSRLHIQFPARPPPPSITSYSICAPPPTPHAPQPCYDDASLPIAVLPVPTTSNSNALSHLCPSPSA